MENGTTVKILDQRKLQEMGIEYVCTLAKKQWIWDISNNKWHQQLFILFHSLHSSINFSSGRKIFFILWVVRCDLWQCKACYHTQFCLFLLSWLAIFTFTVSPTFVLFYFLFPLVPSPIMNSCWDSSMSKHLHTSVLLLLLLLLIDPMTPASASVQPHQVMHIDSS